MENNIIPKSLLPSLASAINPYHGRAPLERLIPSHEAELYESSFFSPSTTILWNSLPENIQHSSSNSKTKRYLQRNDHSVPPYFYIGACLLRIIHIKLCLRCYQRPAPRPCSSTRIKWCFCISGTASETVEHYLLHRPLNVKINVHLYSDV